MPDRAVVDEDVCPQRMGIAGSWHHWSIPWEDGKRRCLDCGLVQPEHQPRAVVAISDDQQWLVVLPPKAAHWHVYQFVQPGAFYFQSLSHGWRDQLLDTGQDAHEVLAAFLEGRGG